MENISNIKIRWILIFIGEGNWRRWLFLCSLLVAFISPTSYTNLSDKVWIGGFL